MKFHFKLKFHVKLVWRASKSRYRDQLFEPQRACMHDLAGACQQHVGARFWHAKVGYNNFICRTTGTAP